MSLQSTQGRNVQLVANGVILDLFKDEEIKISNNVTGLFDLGILPSDFTRQITLPGTKKNNAFFEHVYDISITNPYLFSTNQKVDAYFDFGGIYISNGYLQLNKVNVLENKFIDSYEVTIYGTVSSFARDISRNTLNDLSTLSQYNHTSSFSNITSSWSGSFFNGDIVYPLADYGKNIFFSEDINNYGVNTFSSSLTIQDFKPAIRATKVVDAIFEEYGYTYESDFLTSSFFDNIYTICNYGGRYPRYPEVDLEQYGVAKVTPLGDIDADYLLTANTYANLPFGNTEYDYSGFIGDDMSYSYPRFSSLECEINLVMQVSGSLGFPQFTLQIADTGSYVNNGTIVLDAINLYFRELQTSQSGPGDKTYKLYQKVKLPASSKTNSLRIKYENYAGSDFTVTLNPDGDTDSYLKINKVTNAADFRIMDIPLNMPYGTDGIKQIDYIRALQLKYNLVIYPSKTKPKHFIIDTFNNWYKKGVVKDFNSYINLDKKISVTPANNLAVNKLQFGDTLGEDYLSQQFKKISNREYGKTYYTDVENFFSQGEYKVETTSNSIPLKYVEGTGVSGSLDLPTGYPVSVQITKSTSAILACSTILSTLYIDRNDTFPEEGDVLYIDQRLRTVATGYRYMASPGGDIYSINPSTGEVGPIIGTCGG